MGQPASHSLPRLVSVVVPVGAFDHATEAQLKALSTQTYAGPWELVVVNNVDDKRIEEDVRKLLGGVLAFTRIVPSPDASNAAAARNAGIDLANGDLFAFCDSDDRVTPTWLEELVDGALGSDLVGGWLNTEPLNGQTYSRWRSSYSRNRLPTKFGFLPYSQAANLAVWRYVVDSIGVFDSQLDAAEDIDFCWRAQLAGFSLGFAPNAEVWYRHRSTLRELARQFFSYGIADATIRDRYKQHLDHEPWILSLGRGVTWLTLRSPYLIVSQAKRGIWVRELAHFAGRAVGEITLRMQALRKDLRYQSRRS